MRTAARQAGDRDIPKVDMTGEQPAKRIGVGWISGGAVEVRPELGCQDQVAPLRNPLEPVPSGHRRRSNRDDPRLASASSKCM
jgi:hypothetical protein